MQNGTNYATSDLYNAAYLQASGFKLIEIKPSGSRKLMVFEMTVDEGQQETANYYNGEEISALEYANCVKNLKTQIANTR
jgi:hypothetical protein